MALRITFLGHAGFLLQHQQHSIAIDPFLTDNPVAKHKPSDIKVGSIILTHGHADHFGDTVEIAKANDAEVLAAYEICEYLGEQGVKGNPGNPGGRIDTDFGYVAFTRAFHSSSYKGRYMGMPCGVVVNIGGVTFYHAGDTDLFSDMKLIGQIYKPDIAAIPIGDRFTMGPQMGAMAAQWIGAKVAIPIHYKTWPLLGQSTEGFEPEGIEVKEMEAGETWSYG